MKTKTTPWRASLLAAISVVALGPCVAPTAKAQPTLGLFAPPNVGAPKTRVGGGVRGGLTLPQVGAPKTRVGGGVLGGSEENTNHLMSMPVVFVLTPESTGYTVSESPTLYYYVTDDTSFEFEITVNRDERTVVQMRRWEKIKPALHGISLGDLGIKAGGGGRLRVERRADPEPAARLAGHYLDRRIRRIKAKEPMKDFNDYGKHGIWYDMLQDLTEKITADPSNKVLLKERGDLFKQVGLPEVADLDYAAAKTKG
jgi:hypothetical protein